MTNKEYWENELRDLTTDELDEVIEVATKLKAAACKEFYLPIAQADYTILCGIFDGKPFDKETIQSIVDANYMSYGALCPINGGIEEGLIDINYEHILATIRNDDGICHVNDMVEIYDNNGNQIDYTKMRC